MKCRHLVSFTQSCYLTVDYDVYRMSYAHFSHFSLTTEMDYWLVLNFAFPCGLRGFHVYKELWNPGLNKKLDTVYEENNPYDRYAAAAIRKSVSRLRPVVVGLPWVLEVYFLVKTGEFERESRDNEAPGTRHNAPLSFRTLYDLDLNEAIDVYDFIT